MYSFCSHPLKNETHMKILLAFYSTYGHPYKMAQAVAEGAQQVEDADVEMRKIPETLGAEILEKTGASNFQKTIESIPDCTLDDLANADAIIFGTPTRFGNMCGQLRQFLDSTGPLWAKGTLIGKIASVFTSSATQHGGQESTILSTHITLLHHGMVIVGLPYSFEGQNTIDEITGCSPYGASTIAGQGNRMPSKNELEGAKFQGRHVASITKKLVSSPVAV
jgi:NAD(P)H dehydrogenase (quinone)